MAGKEANGGLKKHGCQIAIQPFPLMVVIVPRNAESDTRHLKPGFPGTWRWLSPGQSPG